MKSYTYVARCVLLSVALSQAHGQTRVDLRTQTKSVDFSTAASTKPSKTGTTLPASCAVGETFIKTDAAPGANLYLCTATNLWTAQGGSSSLPSMAGAADKVLSTDGSGAQWRALGGDISGAPGAVRVDRVQGRSVANTNPTDRQVLRWNAASSQWEPSTESGAVASVFGRTGSVTAQSGDYTAAQVTNAADKTASNTYSPGAKQAFQASTTTAGARIVPAPLPTAPAAGDLAADAADANRLKTYDGTGWTVLGQGTANYGLSFTGQTTVTLAGTAHKLGTANLIVSCYDSATPAKRIEPDSVTIHPTTYDVTVTFTNAQSGRCVANGSGGSAGGGGGASMAAQLGDFSVARTSSTVLTVGGNCSTATPCNARFGNLVYSITQSATATLSGGTGTAYIYITGSGVLTVGHNVTLSCSAGCTAIPGITAFPPDSLPLYTWDAAGGAWNADGGTDRRAWLSTKAIMAGTGIATTQSSGQTTVGVDTATVPTYLTASATLNFPSIANGGCASDQTISLPGASAGDSVAPGWPAGLEAGLVGTMRVSAANTVSVRICNLSGGSLDPASATFRATVVRSF